MNTIFEEPARQESDLSEPEFDWSLDKAELFIAEQEARFKRSRSGRVFTRVFAPCPVCDMRHVLTFCPFVFEDNPQHLGTPKDKIREFAQRMRELKEFRDAVEYLRKIFTRREVNLHHSAVPRFQTQDAPPLARGKKTCQTHPSACDIELKIASMILIATAWLSRFDSRVNLCGNSRGSGPQAWEFILPAFSYFPGYFPTTDDDGRPFLILFANSGHLDERLPYGMSSSHILLVSRLAGSIPLCLCFTCRSGHVLGGDLTSKAAQGDHGTYCNHLTVYGMADMAARDRHDTSFRSRI